MWPAGDWIPWDVPETIERRGRGMRSIEGPGGISWDVVVGRASWGVFHALFIPRRGDEARQVMLQAESAEEAARLLEELTHEALVELLETSEPRDP